MAKLRDPERRALILETAMPLFSERGFYGVSVKDIANASNIALGSMYTYFDSKEQLINELYREWKRVFGAYIRKGLAPPLRGRSVHRALWKNIGRFILDHPVAFLFLEAHHHASYLDDESNALESSINQFAIEFYLGLDLDLQPNQVQLVIAASFGAFVQSFKASLVGRIRLDEQMLEKLESVAWTIASNS